MTITFQKRQKEMKRLEKAKEKAEKRAQRKLAKKNGELPKEDEFEIIPPYSDSDLDPPLA
jgi:hypothetical protein